MRCASALLTAVLLGACANIRDAGPFAESEWMRAMYGAMRAERMSPPVASRLLAYTTAAWYAGVATEDDELGPLAGRLNGFPGLPDGSRRAVDGVVVATSANRVIVDSLLREALPITRSTLLRLADSLDAARAAEGGGVGPDAMQSSRDLGREIGERIVAWARQDNFDGTRGRGYAAPVGPGYRISDAPATTYASQSTSGASELVSFDNPANVMQAGAASDRALILSRQKRAVPTMPPTTFARSIHSTRRLRKPASRASTPGSTFPSGMLSVASSAAVSARAS